MAEITNEPKWQHTKSAFRGQLRGREALTKLRVTVRRTFEAIHE